MTETEFDIDHLHRIKDAARNVVRLVFEASPGPGYQHIAETDAALRTLAEAFGVETGRE